EDVEEGGAAVLPEIEHRLRELSAALAATDDDQEADRQQEQITALRRKRRDARASAPQVVQREVRSTQTYGQDWADADTVEDQRAVLDDALTTVVVRRGRVGRGLDTGRLTFQWKHPEQVGPMVPPDDATLAAWES